MRRTFGVLLALLAAWMALPAPARACTDGVNCLCDRPEITGDPNVVKCQDFERPDLDTDYGASKEFGNDFRGQCQGSYFFNGGDDYWSPVVGTCETCCFQVVTDGACGASGETDCAIEGQAIAARFVPDKEFGIFGQQSLGADRRTFGVTMAVKWSANYVKPTVANKFDEFGNCAHPLMGSATNNISSNNVPWDASAFGDETPATFTLREGQYQNVLIAGPDFYAYKWAPDPGEYTFDSTWPQETWVCYQLHVKDFGLSTATVRQWMTPATDLVRRNLIDVDVDLSHLRDASASCGGDNDQTGISELVFNAYYNPQSTDPNRLNGYPSNASEAARFTDALVVTTASEPVPCSTLGGIFAAGGGADISIGTPVLTLDPVTGYAPVSVDASVPFADAGGTVSLYVDCAGGTSWVGTGVSGTASPLSAPDVCSYATQVGAPTAIAFRVVDGDGSDEDSGTAAVSIAENPAKWAEGAIPNPTSGYIDSPFLSFDSNRIYFLYSPKAVTDYFAGTSEHPEGAALEGHQGDTDLYYVEWNGSSWSAPVNLGTNINTSDSECCMWVNEAETQIIFWRTGALTGATNLVATRASKADPWGTPSGMAGELGSTNQNPPTNYRTDINVDPATLDLYLWEHDSVTNGILQRAPWNGSGWDALVDLTALDDADDDDTQPVVSRDGLTLLWNRRGSDAITELMRATRATTGDSWGTPASVTLNGFEDGASIQAWGELSFDGDEQGFVAVRFDTTVPGWAAHLIHVDGGAGASSYGPPVDLNDYVEPQKCTPENPCCCLATPP